MALIKYFKKSMSYYVKKYLGYPDLWLRDLAKNRRYATADRKFLVVRHGGEAPDFYNIILDWAAEEFPEIRARFELHQLPCRAFSWSDYALHIPWLQDPVQQWSVLAYHQANRVAEECDRRGIPIINRVDKLINATKSNGARILRDAGIRTPRMAPIENFEEFRETLHGMPLPLIVREDWGHGGAMLLVKDIDAIRKMRLEEFTRPVAVEFIDTRNPSDGLYRKYRYVAAGERGVAQTMHVQNNWIVRGAQCEFSRTLVDEEIAFIDNPDPNHVLLQKARQALELDFVAFDYSYDRDGTMIVWEANPYPYLHFLQAGSRRYYRRAAVERTLAAILALYLERAGLPVPSRIEDMVAGYSPSPHGTPN